MNYTCSNTVIKYLMFTFNFIFVITGIIIIAVGVSVKSHYSDYDFFLDSKYFTLPNMLIATGSLIFLISFLGCFGAMRENWMMLMAFSVCLAIIFIFELSVGIAGYVLRDKTSSYLEKELSESMKQYIESPKMWDAIQVEFKCCGVHNYRDWNQTFGNDSLPISCCPGASGTVGVFYCNAVSPTTQPTQPTEPTKPTEATQPTEATKPTEATQPTEATKPTEATQPTEATKPTEATQPTEATKPTEATQPTEATEATEPTKPPLLLESVNNPISNLLIPESPVKSDDNGTTPAYPPSSSQPYSTGCEAAFGDFIKKHAVDIGAVGIALAVIQIFGIAFSFHMARQLKNGYYST